MLCVPDRQHQIHRERTLTVALPPAHHTHPLSLPSHTQEHAGNDPNTQLVPAAGGSGWQTKSSGSGAAEGEGSSSQQVGSTASPAAAAAPAAPQDPSAGPGAGAAGPGGTGSSSPWATQVWQPPPATAPPAPQPFRASSFISDSRRAATLNPEEYPSLSATAKATDKDKATYHAKQQTTTSTTSNHSNRPIYDHSQVGVEEQREQACMKGCVQQPDSSSLLSALLTIYTLTTHNTGCQGLGGRREGPSQPRSAGIPLLF